MDGSLIHFSCFDNFKNFKSFTFFQCIYLLSLVQFYFSPVGKNTCEGESTRKWGLPPSLKHLTHWLTQRRHNQLKCDIFDNFVKKKKPVNLQKLITYPACILVFCRQVNCRIISGPLHKEHKYTCAPTPSDLRPARLFGIFRKCHIHLRFPIWDTVRHEMVLKYKYYMKIWALKEDILYIKTITPLIREKWKKKKTFDFCRVCFGQ